MAPLVDKMRNFVMRENNGRKTTCFKKRKKWGSFTVSVIKNTRVGGKEGGEDRKRDGLKLWSAVWEWLMLWGECQGSLISGNCGPTSNSWERRRRKSIRRKYIIIIYQLLPPTGHHCYTIFVFTFISCALEFN